MVGNQIEHYRIAAVLGEGGMGIVYKAFDTKLERFVALKILSSQSVSNPKFLERFKREAKNQAKLSHPNIVAVYGLTEDVRTLGIVMEYVEGETLEHMITRLGRIELLEALKIIKQVLAGAGYAHAKGFVHRDIKPSNIIINSEGVVKIMDFGISKSVNESKGITKTGMKIGTVLYMSPEQIKAMEPTNQSDIYSIGITFYEMLTGRNPFDLNSEFEIMEAHLKKNPPKVSSLVENIPGAADNLINRAMSKVLTKRYKSCEEFGADADDLIHELSNPVKSGKKAVKRKPSKNTAGRIKFKGKIKFYLMSLIFLAVFSGLFYFVYNTVSQFWQSGDRTGGLTGNYSSNPSFMLKSAWKKVNSGTQGSLNSIGFIDDSTGFACGASGLVLKTTDGGINWAVISDSSSIDLYCVKFLPIGRGFISGQDGTILMTTDAGRNWTKLESGVSESLFKIYFLKDNSVGFIAGAGGVILKTEDGGITWDRTASPTKNLLYSISFQDNNNGLIVGWDGTILRTTDGGGSWSVSKKISEQYLRDVCFFNGSDGIAVGGGGQIARTDNGGEDWDVIKSPTYNGLFSVLFADKNHGIILSNKGEILISDDGGKEWRLTSSGGYSSLSGITENPADKIFIVGENGTILTQ